MEYLGILANLGNAGLLFWRLYKEIKKTGSLKTAIVSLISTVSPEISAKLMEILDKLDGEEMPPYSIETMINNLAAKTTITYKGLPGKFNHPTLNGSGQIKRFFQRRRY